MCFIRRQRPSASEPSGGNLAEWPHQSCGFKYAGPICQLVPRCSISRLAQFVLVHLCCSAAIPAHAALPRVALPVRGIPSELRSFTGLYLDSRGCAAVCGAGLLLNIGQPGYASLQRSPLLGELRVVERLGDDYLVAGTGDIFRYSVTTGAWTGFGIDGQFNDAVSVPEGVLFVGQGAVYLVKSEGAELVRKLPTSRLPLAQSIGGRPYLFAAAEGIFRWEGGRLQSAESEMPWAVGLEIASIQELPGNRLITVTNRGVFLVEDNVASELHRQQVRSLIKEMVLHVSLWGDALVFTTFRQGVIAMDVHSGHELWRVKAEHLGGNVYSALNTPSGLLLGTSAGVYVLPAPDRFQLVGLPPGEPRFATTISSGNLIGTTSGVFQFPNGDKLYGDVVRSLIEPTQGQIVEGHFGEVVGWGQSHRVGGREVMSMVQFCSSKLAVRQPHGVSLLSESGDVMRVEGIGTATTIVRGPDETLLVGTTSGAARINASGSVVARFGKTATHVFEIGEKVRAFETTGSIYDVSGHRVASMPPATVIDAIEYRDRLCVLARLNDGNEWLGFIDESSSKWIPLRVPLPPAATKLMVHGEDLIVVAPDVALVVTAPLPLPPPLFPATPVRTNTKKRVGPVSVLPSDEDSIWIEAPRGDPFIQRTPQTRVEINGSSHSGVGEDGHIWVPRLYWGTNKIVVTAAWAGLEQVQTFVIERRRPWWGRPLAYLLYALSILSCGSVLAYIRFRRLRNRALQLEQQVSFRTADLQKMLKAREAFFSTLSHEIRNPLNGVVGLCQILNREDQMRDPEKQRTLLRTLQGCSDQLRSIVDDVLDFTRIDRGEIQLHPEPFELNTAVEGAVRAADPELIRSKLKRSPEEVWILGDQGKLRQIVTNLVSNALKYGVPPEAQILTRATPDANGQVALRIAVVNTGPVIPKEELELIFSGFVRGRDATRRRIQGTGLGLAVSQRIAHAMGGKLAVCSEHQRTEFELNLRLPATDARPAPRAACASPKKRRVLAIEDEPYNRLVLQHTLADLGYEADWAADGATALEKVQHQTYDLIITDLALPDISGFELAEKIRSHSHPPPKMIAVSAFSTPDKIAHAGAVGISAVVTKPISTAKLASVLGQV
jgi:signal transduction histidine kinase/CheY-like chemotaxis protein